MGRCLAGWRRQVRSGGDGALARCVHGGVVRAARPLRVALVSNDRHGTAMQRGRTEAEPWQNCGRIAWIAGLNLARSPPPRHDIARPTRQLEGADGEILCIHVEAYE